MKFLTPIDVDGYVKADHLKISTASTESVDVGEIVWNQIDGTFDMGLIGGVTLQSGQEMHIYGKASEAITNGDAVMFAGVQGDHILIARAEPTAINTNPEHFIGIATQDFAINQFGYTTVFGNVRTLNTSSYTLGAILYFASDIPMAGKLTTTMPVAPNAKITVAAVLRVHANEGMLMVRPHVMPKIQNLQDVYAPSPINNQGLFWNSTTLRYEAKAIATVLGYTPANDDNVVHLTGNETITGFKTFNTSSTYEDVVRFGGGINNRYLYVYNDGYGTGLANGPLFAGESIYFYNGGNSIDFSTNSVVRAIIDSNGLKSSAYYDFDNTSYYLNPAGSSNLYNVTANSFIKSGGTSAQFLKADGSVDSTSYYPASNPNGYISSYSETDTLATVTARGATTSTGVGFNNYVNILGQNSVYWYNTGNGAYARTYFDGSTFNLDRSLWVTANIYGDVFYDRNNSAYYVDPASTSYLNIITTAGYVAVGTTSTSYKLHVAGGQYGTYLKGGDSGTGSDILRLVDVFSNTKYLARGDGKHFFTGDTDIAGDLQLGGNYLRFNQSGTRSWNQIASGGNLYLNSGDGSGYFIPTMAMQTPIIYDYNNSAYYLDPASTSNLNGLTVAGTITGNISGASSTANLLNRVGSASDANTMFSDTTAGNMGWNDAYNPTNGAIGANWANYLNMRHENAGSQYGTQLAISWSGTDIMKYRSVYGGSWQAWKTVLDSANYNGYSNFSGAVYGTIYYDANNTGYYVDPSSTSNLNNVILNSQNSFNTTTPGLTSYGLTFMGGTSDYANGMIWTWGNTNAQAGVYVQSSGAYGTKMYFATTDSFATGAKTAMSIDHSGNVSLNRGTFSNGSVWINNGVNYNGYNENIRLFNAPNGVSVIGFGASGTSGTPQSAILGYSDRYEVRVGAGNQWQQRSYDGYTEIYGSSRAPLFYDSNNTGYYVDPNSTSRMGTVNADLLRSYSNLYLDSDYGRTVVGVYSSTRYQGVFAMGDAYKLSVDGTTTGSLYGLAWSHPNAGGVAGNLNTHGLLAMENGTWLASLTGSTRARDDMRAPVFYDNNDTSYFFDGSSTGDSIRVAGDIVAYYSDERLKDRKGNIENALEKVLSLNGFYYTPNAKAQELGYKYKEEVGVSAQEVEAILPELIKDAPIGQGYKTLNYGKLTPLLIEAIKEQQTQIDELKQLVNHLINK